MKAMVPVSLRKAGDIDSPNAVGAISADLGTNLKDPLKRFAVIQASMRAGKDMFKDMSAKESELFMQVTQLPGVLLIPLGLISRFPPFNTVILCSRLSASGSGRGAGAGSGLGAGAGSADVARKMG